MGELVLVRVDVLVSSQVTLGASLVPRVLLTTRGSSIAFAAVLASSMHAVSWSQSNWSSFVTESLFGCWALREILFGERLAEGSENVESRTASEDRFRDRSTGVAGDDAGAEGAAC
jgi:hypothetical protein